MERNNEEKNVKTLYGMKTFWYEKHWKPKRIKSHSNWIYAMNSIMLIAYSTDSFGTVFISSVIVYHTAMASVWIEHHQPFFSLPTCLSKAWNVRFRWKLLCVCVCVCCARVATTDENVFVWQYLGIPTKSFRTPNRIPTSHWDWAIVIIAAIEWNMMTKYG